MYRNISGHTRQETYTLMVTHHDISKRVVSETLRSILLRNLNPRREMAHN